MKSTPSDQDQSPAAGKTAHTLAVIPATRKSNFEQRGSRVVITEGGKKLCEVREIMRFAGEPTAAEIAERFVRACNSQAAHSAVATYAQSLVACFLAAVAEKRTLSAHEMRDYAGEMARLLSAVKIIK